MEKSKIISSFNVFSITTNDGQVFDAGQNGTEILFPLGSKQIIIINAKNVSIQFDLNSGSQDTNIFSLSKARFESCNMNVNILDEIKDNFNLEKRIEDNKDYFSLYFESNNGFGVSKIAIKKDVRNKVYCLIFASKKSKESGSLGEDYYSDDIILVKYLAEVELETRILDFIYK